MSVFASLGRLTTGAGKASISSARNRWSQKVATAATLDASYSPSQYYGLLWYFYQNTIYYGDLMNDIFRVKADYLARQRIYPKTRGIYNPVTRLVNAYVANTFGGMLDMGAGDGELMPSAVPIWTPNEAIRPAIAALWKASNFEITKSRLTRYGHALGNVGVRIIDDTQSGKVRLEVVPPWEVTDLQLDAYDNVTYWRQEYDTEIMYRDQFDRVQTEVHTFAMEIDQFEFRTYLDNEPFGFTEYGGLQSWPNPYGFVPCIWIKNIDAGSDLGLCSFHNSIPTINTLNEVASHLAEQIQKSVHPQWLLTGTSEPKAGKFTGGRKVWVSPNENTKAIILNDRLDITGVVGLIDSYIKELERDYPILGYYVIRNRMGSGDLTGRAVSTMLHDMILDVNERRVPYDSGLVRAHKMALSIGGWRGYKNYEPFDLQEAFEEGRLDHFIGARKLIDEDPADRLTYMQQYVNLATQLLDETTQPEPQPPTNLINPSGQTISTPQAPVMPVRSLEELASVVQDFQQRIKTGMLDRVK